ncbi:LiaF transmembrane domain-containing protein [Undibacterium sp. TJN19]|uniref:LiaF transmembrane domain-containing protein n=1 Tax=Undibacterium sp. TJN19 TaxID=3413055 RepID=UPI003BF3F8C3
MDEQFENQRYSKGNVFFGLALIVAGSVFLMDHLGLLNAIDYWFLLPALIALSGLVDIISPRKPKHIAKGCFNMVIAFWLYVSIEHLWGWNFYTSWPLLLIAFGIQHIVAGLLATGKQEK